MAVPAWIQLPLQGRARLTPHSTAGRFLSILRDLGGALVSPHGAAGMEAARLLGLGTQSALPLVRRLDRDSYIHRRGNRSRTYEIHLTALGHSTIAGWSQQTTDGLPWFPTTADAMFRTLMRALDLPYTLHSLRHFVATHLYNRKRDWVQLARFLGHSNPAITMNLYANHVIDASQLELGEAAMDLYEEPGIDISPGSEEDT